MKRRRGRPRKSDVFGIAGTAENAAAVADPVASPAKVHTCGSRLTHRNLSSRTSKFALVKQTFWAKKTL
jgi:hypothetical protein